MADFRYLNTGIDRAQRQAGWELQAPQPSAVQRRAPSSPALVRGQRFPHRWLGPGKTRRSQGSSIAEFPVAFFALIFCGFLPACNLVLFCSAYLGLQHLTVETANSIAMSESIDQAEARARAMADNYQNPILTLGHPLRSQESAGPTTCQLTLLAGRTAGDMQAFELRKLPRNIQPSFKDNSNRLIYLYRLQVRGLVYPIANLSAIPIVGQVPLIGAPANVLLSADAPVENLNALNH